MVATKLKDLDIEKVKMAKDVMAILEVLGIDEDDLLLIKKIPAILEELNELRQFKADVTRTLETKTANSEAKPVGEVVKNVYKGDVKEFNPHYEQ
jgi:hypothetical protein